MSRAAEARRARMEMQRQLKSALHDANVSENRGFGGGDVGAVQTTVRKNLFDMRADANFNVNPVLANNITRSDYYRSLSKHVEFQQVVDEIYYKVTHLEPWTHSGSKTPSTGFCLLYKLFTLGLTNKQVTCLLDHGDSPYIRGIGFLFLRFVCPPADLWRWLGSYLDDEEEIAIERQYPNRMISIGDFVRDLIELPKFLGAQLPRIPRPIEMDIKVKILHTISEKARLKDNLRERHRFTAGTPVQAKFSEDGTWYAAVIEGPGSSEDRVWVVYKEYGNREQVSLGAIKLESDRDRSLDRTDRSRATRRSRSRSRSRSHSPIRSRIRSRSRSRSRSPRRKRERRSRSTSSERRARRRRRGDAGPSRESERRREKDSDRGYNSGRNRDSSLDDRRDSYRDKGRDYRSGRYMDEQSDEELRRRVTSAEKSRALRDDASGSRNRRNGRGNTPNDREFSHGRDRDHDHDRARDRNYDRARHQDRDRDRAPDRSRVHDREPNSAAPPLSSGPNAAKPLDPETLARRQAELDRLKQRYG